MFDSYPSAVRKRLLDLRDLIFSVAESTEGVGEIEEALRWGEPAYLTSKTRSGSTVRLGWKESNPDTCAVHFNCNTNLVERFRTWFPHELTLDANRSVLSDLATPIPKGALRECIAAALLYHKTKRRK